jgi:hypothetical protein
MAQTRNANTHHPTSGDWGKADLTQVHWAARSARASGGKAANYWIARNLNDVSSSFPILVLGAGYECCFDSLLYIQHKLFLA